MTETQQEWLDRVTDACNATKYRMINPGICPPCPQCQSDYGLDEDALETEDICDEGGLSWYECEVCRCSLGGDRYAAHGHADDGSIMHYDICADCLFYLANGDLPETPYE